MRFRSINVNGPAPIADCLRYIQTGYPCTHFMFICKTCHFHFRSIIFYWYALRDIFSQCKNMKCSVEETYKKNVSLLILYFTKETKQKKKVQGRRAHIPCCMFIKMLDKMKFKSIIKITGCICNYIYRCIFGDIINSNRRFLMTNTKWREKDTYVSTLHKLRND